MFRFVWRRVSGEKILLLFVVLLFLFYLSKDFLDFRTYDTGVQSFGTQQQDEIISWPSCEKDLSAESIINFSSFPYQMQEFLYYRHCRHFPMLLDVPDKCGGAHRSSEVFLLLVIKSQPENYNSRGALRRTWAKDGLSYGVQIRRIFVTGTSGSGLERKRLNRVLEFEHSQHRDILQWDFNDTFYTLTLKQILFLEWMERRCPKVHFLLNGDEDVFVNTNNVVKYLQNHKDNARSKHLYAGAVNRYERPIRNSWMKYFVPVELYKSDQYPPYCSGGGFFLSGFSALVIYHMSKSISLLPIDDVYIGMCLAKAGLSPVVELGVNVKGVVPLLEHEDVYDPCIHKNFLVVHGFLPADLDLMWHRINDPNLKCLSRKIFLETVTLDSQSNLTVH